MIGWWRRLFRASNDVTNPAELEAVKKRVEAQGRRVDRIVKKYQAANDQRDRPE